MAIFEQCLPHLRQWEGGWTNDPNDLGGATNCGIIFAFFQRYSWFAGIESPTIDALKALTWPQAEKIYRATFWQWIQGDAIQSQKVALALFDHCVNADELNFARGIRTSRAVSMIQKLVNVPQTGIMDNPTITAINKSSENDLFEKFQNERRAYYKYIAQARPQNQVFLKGWIARVDALPA